MSNGDESEQSGCTDGEKAQAIALSLIAKLLDHLCSAEEHQNGLKEIRQTASEVDMESNRHKEHKHATTLVDSSHTSKFDVSGYRLQRSEFESNPAAYLQRRYMHVHVSSLLILFQGFFSARSLQLCNRLWQASTSHQDAVVQFMCKLPLATQPRT